MQQTEIDRHAQALSQLNMKLLFVGCVTGLALVLIIFLYRNRQQFYKLTYQDQLTGLYNRRYLFLVFNKLQRKFFLKKQPLTALMLDLDHFKRVNDEYGHGIGDEVLVNFALCCKRILPDNSVIIRLGGEEVLALLPDKNYVDGFKMAETLRIALEKMVVTTPDDQNVKITVSIGVAGLSDLITDQKQLLQIVDQRLYRAKLQGRNQVIGIE